MAGGNSHQQNKKHKTGKHESKGQRHKHREQKAGKHIIGIKASSKPNASSLRNDRLAAAKNARDQKRAEVLNQKRSQQQGAPKVVSLLLLSDDVDADRTWALLTSACHELNASGAVSTIGRPKAEEQKKPVNDDDSDDGMMEAPRAENYEEGVNYSALVPRTLVVNGKVKLRVHWSPPPKMRADPMEIVEIGKTADVVLLCVSGREKDIAVDAEGEMALQTLMALGLPSVFGVAAPSINEDGSGRKGQMSLKDRSAAKKHAAAAIEAKLAGDFRVFNLDSLQDAVQVVRAIAELPPFLPQWRQRRPYVIVEDARIADQPAASTSGRVTLRIAGYVRGNGGLSANQAVHVCGAGDFLMDRLTAPQDPNRRNKGFGGAGSGEELVMVAGPGQDSLVRENAVDHMDGEQTWPTEEEMAEAERRNNTVRRMRVPKGTSAYQAAWILDDEEGGDEDDGDEGDDGMFDDEIPDAVEMDEGEEEEGSDTEYEEIVDDAGTDILGGDDEDEEDDDDEGRVKKRDAAAEKAEEAKKRHEEGEDLDFPDEVDTPVDQEARKRFAKYRGLKSFRSSPWDPKESLPQDYARVFAFENFRRAYKRAIAAADKIGFEEPGALPGTYVALYVRDVPLEVAQWIVGRTEASTRGEAPPVVTYGLLQHECKLSVLHFTVKKVAEYSEPVRSKDPLLLCTGVRIFQGRPIYSSDEHNADKFKMERFLHAGRHAAASIYAPIMYHPMPLLAFKLPTSEGGVPRLVATGSLKSVNPDRVVLKKIILTGFPVRVHKRRATVKHMFYNPEDVKWFRPLEIYTKYGRRGRIKEPLGTKGLMKVIFDGTVQQRDTVCMSLYKRVFPKWPETMEFA